MRPSSSSRFLWISCGREELVVVSCCFSSGGVCCSATQIVLFVLDKVS